MVRSAARNFNLDLWTTLCITAHARNDLQSEQRIPRSWHRSKYYSLLLKHCVKCGVRWEMVRSVVYYYIILLDVKVISERRCAFLGTISII